MPTRDAINALKVVWDASPNGRTWSAPSALTVTLQRPIGLAVVEALREADVYVTTADPNIQRLLDSAQAGNIPSGASIVLNVPRTSDRFVVVEDIDELLNVPGAQITEPATYVFFSTKPGSAFFAHVRGEKIPSENVPLVRYHAAIRLWSVLEGQAQHVDAANGALLFFGIRRTEIAPGFSRADLADDVCVEAIAAFVGDEDRKATRAEIFASVLSEFLRDLGPSSCFRFLLRDSSRFARRLKEGLAIYLAEHSPEKLAEDAKAAAVGLSEKIEKVVAGIETKSLTVPAALLLAVKDVDQGAGMVAINVVIISAAAAFAGTMLLIDRSQRSLLGLLSQTIDGTTQEFRKKGLDDANPIVGVTFGSLKDRCATATRWSVLMFGASWVPLACVIWTVFCGTPKVVPAVRIPTPASAPGAPVAAAPTRISTPPPSPSVQFVTPPPAAPTN